MRYAKAKELWEKLAKRNAASAPAIYEVKFEKFAGFKDGAFSVESGFLCICGGTGQGKTALLQLIGRALNQQDQAKGAYFPVRVGGAEVTVRVGFGQDEFTLTGTSGGYPSGVQLIDLWDRTSGPVRYFRSQRMDVLKEGITPKELSKELVEDISAACHKKYDLILVFEVEGEDEEIFPFFEVIENGLQYDSLNMATGELSILYIAWALNRSDRGAIFLIEEPEAYLPPISHEHVAHLMASAAYRRGLGMIFSTHSSNLVDAIPEVNILPLRKEAGQSVVAKGPQAKTRALQRLGLRPYKKAILVVEDQCAQFIAREIIGGAGTDFWVEAEIVIEPTGQSGIREFVRRVPKLVRSTEIIGVLDGDQRGKIGADETNLQIAFLPMNAAPEIELVQSIRDNITRFARLSGRRKEDVEDALENAMPLDKHELLHALGRSLNMSAEAIMRISFDLWRRKPNRKRVIDAFLNKLSGFSSK